MIDYFSDESDSYDMYEEISEKEALNIIGGKKRMSLKTLALEIAETAHAGQFDKAEKPYIEHPKQVAAAFEDEERYMTALLHDVIEDSDFEASTLISMGIPINVVTAVETVTKIKGEPYFDYLKKIKINPIARDVKLEDLKHNMDLKRLDNPTEKDFGRAREV